MRVTRIRPAAAALAGALAVGGLVVTPTAQAAITGSQITTPTDPSFLVADETAATQTFAISGTTSGGNPATDKVDVRCYYDGTSALVAKNVALGANRSFSVPAADLLAPCASGNAFLMGFALASERAHGPDEHFHLENFRKGIEATVGFWRRYS